MKAYCIIAMGMLMLFSKSLFAQAQDTTELGSLSQVQDSYVDQLNKKVGKMKSMFQGRTAGALHRFKQQELKLKRMLGRKDSVAANTLFSDIDSKYGALDQSTQQADRYYLPYLDTLHTSLKFLYSKKDFLKNINNDQLKSSMDNLESLERQLQHSEQVQQFILARTRLLQEQLKSFGRVAIHGRVGIRRRRRQVDVDRHAVDGRDLAECWNDGSQLGRCCFLVGDLGS